MSIKNQKTLLISASLIIGLTLLILFGLNYIVEKISQTPPSPTFSSPLPPNNMPGIDDALDQKKPSKFDMPSNGKPFIDDQARPPVRMWQPDKKRMPNKVMRRVRNGKDAPDLKRTRPRAGQTKEDMYRGRPVTPPPMQNNGYYPPPMQVPDNAQLDPKEREMIEREIERRRELFYGPPPEYYPPPGYENDYDDGTIEDRYDYDYDYEYEPGLEGNNLDKPKDIKTASFIDDLEVGYFDEEADPDDEIEDDYINEYYDD
jgi:hypothetical protein